MGTPTGSRGKRPGQASEGRWPTRADRLTPARPGDGVQGWASTRQAHPKSPAPWTTAAQPTGGLLLPPRPHGHTLPTGAGQELLWEQSARVKTVGGSLEGSGQQHFHGSRDAPSGMTVAHCDAPKPLWVGGRPPLPPTAALQFQTEHRPPPTAHGGHHGCKAEPKAWRLASSHVRTGGCAAVTSRPGPGARRASGAEHW